MFICGSESDVTERKFWWLHPLAPPWAGTRCLHRRLHESSAGCGAIRGVEPMKILVASSASSALVGVLLFFCHPAVCNRTPPLPYPSSEIIAHPATGAAPRRLTPQLTNLRPSPRTGFEPTQACTIQRHLSRICFLGVYVNRRTKESSYKSYHVPAQSCSSSHLVLCISVYLPANTALPLTRFRVAKLSSLVGRPAGSCP